jgi:pSer/pThr/pTyr-binding forkhead associated (FHA) protein
LRGNDVVIKDLDSTNGTFINGEKIAESVLQPGQVLRLGNVELCLDTGVPGAAGTPAAAVAPAPAKKTQEGTKLMPRGVSLGELESGGGRPPGFDTSKDFSKKTNKTNTVFLIIGIIAGLVIVALIIYALAQVNPGHR